MKNRHIILAILFSFVALVPALAAGPGAPPATPIDGGLSLLLLAGGAYGIKVIRDRNKE